MATTSKSQLSIYELITHHYQSLMNIAKREYIKINGCNDDDSYKDIAHDTMLKLCDIYDKVPITLTFIKGYYCKAVRNNYLRELIRPNKKYKIDEDFEEWSYKVAESEMDGKLDYYIVLDDVRSNFKDDYQIFLDFIHGFKLRELNEKYNITNADYIVRKIKDYVKSKFDGYEFKTKK